MAREDKKDFNAMLHDSKDMPKFQIITDQKSIEKYGGDRMYFAPPIDYDRVMKQVPCGKVITVGEIREYFAKQSGADFTEPITAGIFVSIAAWASEQRMENKTPYWRTLKAGGELNPKYPGGIEEQREKLEAEGHTVIQKGRTNIRYFVKDYERALFEPENYKIREIRKAEYPILNDFLYEAIFLPEGTQAPPRSVISLPELQVYVKDFGKQKDDICFLAEAGEKVVGAVWTRVMNDYGHIEDGVPSLAISLYKEYRGCGIGTALMKKILQELSQRGYEKVSLSVQKANYAAKMYERVGFETVAETEEEYLMVCRL